MKELSHLELIWFILKMRQPDDCDLITVLFVFLIVIPVSYWMARTVLAFLGL